MVRESRVVAELLINGVTEKQWHRAISEENILQKRTAASATRNARAIRQRLEMLEPEFWVALINADDELATQISLVAALERNPHFKEFMETIVADAYASYQEFLHAHDWLEFLEVKTNSDPEILNLKESSIKKMGQVVFRMLAEAGYIKSTRNLKLQKVILRPELKDLLRQTNRFRTLSCMDITR